MGARAVQAAAVQSAPAEAVDKNSVGSSRGGKLSLEWVELSCGQCRRMGRGLEGEGSRQE